MCGIVGYIGEDQAAPILLKGLKKLEYRGYDSAGVAIYNGKSIQVAKAKGRLKILSEMIHNGKDVPGQLESAIPVGLPMVRPLISTRIRRSAILENLLLCITALSKIIWRLRII